MKIKYTHISDPETEKIHDTAVALAKLPSTLKSRNPTQSEFDAFELDLFKRDKERGIVLSYEIINEN